MKGEKESRSETRPAPPLRLGRIIFVIVAALVVGRTFILDFALVSGRSMLPSLKPGDIVIVVKAAYGLRNPFESGYLLRWGTPEPGAIVAALRPGAEKIIIKRVVTENDSARSGQRGVQAEFFLIGDNRYESLDSREFGPVPMRDIVGKVLLFPGL